MNLVKIRPVTRYMLTHPLSQTPELRNRIRMRVYIMIDCKLMWEISEVSKKYWDR